MEIQHTNDTKRGAFDAIEDGKEAGKMTYSWAGEDKFIIDHTEVYPEFNGNGVGQKMVLEAVDYARKKNVKIMPLCPFAKSVFDRTEAFQDVLF